MFRKRDLIQCVEHCRTSRPSETPHLFVKKSADNWNFLLCHLSVLIGPLWPVKAFVKPCKCEQNRINGILISECIFLDGSPQKFPFFLTIRTLEKDYVINRSAMAEVQAEMCLAIVQGLYCSKSPIAVFLMSLCCSNDLLKISHIK